MKYIGILLTIVCCNFASYSQSFTLSNEHAQFLNGASIYVSGDVGAIMDTFLYVTNVSASNKLVQVKKFEVSMVAGSSNYFCWGGECYGATTFLSPDTSLIAAGQTNPDFSAHYNANGNYGVSHTMYTFFNVANPNDSISVNVYWSALPDAIPEADDILLYSHFYPNPARGIASFDYRFPLAKGVDATLIIRDLRGATVKVVGISDREGSLELDVSDLVPGLYFYTIQAGELAYITRKLVVQ